MVPDRPDRPGNGRFELYAAFGSLVWVYLIGHAGMGGLQHLATEFDLRSMWSLRPQTKKH